MDGPPNFKFEKLLVWQKALDYIELIYKISQNFPKSEIFGLQSQIRRSAVSIALNIAEGSGKTTKKEFRKFLNDSTASLRESITCLHVAKRLSYINHQDFTNSYSKAIEISKMLYSLARSLS